MSNAPIAVLAFTLTFAGAVFSGDAVATPADRGDVESLAAPDASVQPRKMVAFAARRAAIADADLNGVVDRAEADRYYDTRFALMDRDRDGRLSEAEFIRVAAVRSVHALETSWEAQPLDFDTGRLGGHQTVVPEEFLQVNLRRRSFSYDAGVHERRRTVFEIVDRDDDGAVSKQEFLAVGASHFAGSDTDGDGEVMTWQFYRSKRF